MCVGFMPMNVLLTNIILWLFLQSYGFQLIHYYNNDNDDDNDDDDDAIVKTKIYSYTVIFITKYVRLYNEMINCN